MGFLSKLLGFDRPYSSTRCRTYKEIDKKNNINNNKRQEMTNKLAEMFNIFGGSRLPENPKDLTKQGWKDVTHDSKAKNHNGRTYNNPKTNQKVDFDYGKPGEDGFKGKNHYHWHNPYAKNKKVDGMLDKYGRPCGAHSKLSHILPKNNKRRK